MDGVWIDPVTAQVMIALLSAMAFPVSQGVDSGFRHTGGKTSIPAALIGFSIHCTDFTKARRDCAAQSSG
jgi:hypothetical protein